MSNGEEKSKINTEDDINNTENRIALNISFNNTFLQNKILSNEKIINNNIINTNNSLIHKRTIMRNKSSNKNFENSVYENKLTQMNKIINEIYIKERDINFSKPKIEEKIENENITMDDLYDTPSQIFDRFKNIRNNVKYFLI